MTAIAVLIKPAFTQCGAHSQEGVNVLWAGRCERSLQWTLHSNTPHKLWMQSLEFMVVTRECSKNPPLSQVGIINKDTPLNM